VEEGYPTSEGGKGGLTGEERGKPVLHWKKGRGGKIVLVVMPFFTRQKRGGGGGGGLCGRLCLDLQPLTSGGRGGGVGGRGGQSVGQRTSVRDAREEKEREGGGFVGGICFLRKLGEGKGGVWL